MRRTVWPGQGIHAASRMSRNVGGPSPGRPPARAGSGRPKAPDQQHTGSFDSGVIGPCLRRIGEEPLTHAQGNIHVHAYLHTGRHLERHVYISYIYIYIHVTQYLTRLPVPAQLRTSTVTISALNHSFSLFQHAKQLSLSPPPSSINSHSHVRDYAAPAGPE